MQRRIETYQAAKRKNPERWSRSIRDWSLPEFVALNPVSDKEAKELIK